MAFNPSSYFAGVGTVVLAMGLGFSGGLVVTGSNHKFDPPNRVERVASAAPLRSAPSAQASVPLGAPSAPDPEPNPPSSPQGAGTQPSPPPEPVRAAVQPTQNQPAQATGEQHAATNDQPQQAQQPSVQQSTVKPQDDVAKRAAERKQTQHRRWAERRRQRQPDNVDGAVVEVRRQHQPDDADGAVVEVRRQRQPDNADGAVAEVRKIDQPGEGREVHGDLFEMPRLGFFGQ
jgi:hypothetical protein